MREQVIAQCRVVMHLASQLAVLHGDAADLMHIVSDDLLEIHGKRSAYIIDSLLNIMDDMDAFDEEANEWMEHIIDQAKQMFPLA